MADVSGLTSITYFTWLPSGSLATAENVGVVEET